MDARTPLFPSVRIAGDLSATTWYYAIGTDDHPYRVPARQGEALVRREACEVQERWFHDPGGILLVEILVVLRSGGPAFLASAILHEIAFTAAAERITATIPPDAWSRLAAEILRRARAPQRGAAVLARFLTIDGNVSIPVLAGVTGVSSREIHKQVIWSLASGARDSALWSFERGELVKPADADGAA